VVLSREAGAWEELELGGDGALGVNPFDLSGTAEALHRGLTMEPAARAARSVALRTAVARRTSADWWADQLAAAQG
jgi:trehalose 6-phosphate synthase